MGKRHIHLFVFLFAGVTLILCGYLFLLPSLPHERVDPRQVWELSEFKDPKTGQPLFRVLSLLCKDQYRPPIIILKDSEGNLWELYTDNDPKGWIIQRKTKFGTNENIPLKKTYEGVTVPETSW
jgi:hypothetical protein